MVLGGAVLWSGVRLAIGEPYGRLGPIEAFLPVPMLLGALLIGPLPWQWGGGPGRLPHPVRGLLQSLPWNAIWLIALLMGLQAMHPYHPRPEPRPPEPREERENRPVRRPTPFSTVLLTLFLPLVTAAGGLLAYAQIAEERAEQERKLGEETRQLALQSQMQPHALYNAISGLAELAREDGPATEEALIALSRYLRRLQKHCQSRTQSLREERALLESYLAIARIRLGDRLTISWQWPEWADALELPPLLLQPLVENAVEHGVAARAAGGSVRIFVEKEGQDILLGVANDGAPPREDAADGQGLGHLRERLALWSSQKARLELVREGHETIARLHLPGVTA